jgi:branched-chain amino acid transport system substrate-binding protein
MNVVVRAAARRRLYAIGVLGVAVAATLTACSNSNNDQGGSSSSPPSSTAAGTSVLGPDKAATGSPVTVGFINAQGGTTISLPQVGYAAEAAVKYANAHLGGLDGHVIRLDVCHDLVDGASVVACGNQFVHDGDVAVVEGLISAETPIPTVASAGIPWIGNVNTLAYLKLKNVYAIDSTAIADYGALVQAAKDKGYKKILYLTPDTPAATEAVNDILRPLVSGIGATLYYVPIPATVADPTPQVAGGMSKNPNAVWIVGTAPFCNGVLPAISGAPGGNSVPLYMNDSCASSGPLSSLPGGTVEDTTYVPGSADAETRLYEAVMKAYAPAGTELSGNTTFGYLNMLGFIRAVNAGGLSGSVTAQSVGRALRAAKDVPLPLFTGKTFTCDGTAIPKLPAICSAATTTATVSGGKLTDVRVVDAGPLFQAGG